MKDIIGYEGLYKIDTDGRIWRNDVRLKSRISTRGYWSVTLCKNAKPKNFHIHRLLAINFIPNPNNLPQVNHKDGDRLNNDIENLEWITHKDNIRHYIKRGRKPTKTWGLLLCKRTGIFYESLNQAFIARGNGKRIHHNSVEKHDFIRCGNTVG